MIFKNREVSSDTHLRVLTVSNLCAPGIHKNLKADSLIISAYFIPTI